MVTTTLGVLHDEAVRAAVLAAEEAAGEPDTVRLSNNVVFRCKTVPYEALQRAQQNLAEPQPPKFARAGRDRTEENPNDPEYLEAHAAWAEGLDEVVLNTLLLLGAEVEYLPSNVYPVRSDAWLEELALFDLHPDISSRAARYLAWLRYYALPTPEDVGTLAAGIVRQSGVLEGDVDAALRGFRVEVRGESILDAEIRHVVQTGIRCRPIFPGVVPEVEEREVARFSGYTLRAWLRLRYHDRVNSVAYYRIRRLIEMHEQEAIRRENQPKKRRR